MVPDRDKSQLGRLQSENVRLREQLHEYRRLEEDLENFMASRVFQKSRRYLLAWITVGGLALTVTGVVGFRTLADHLRGLAESKLESIGAEQVEKIVREAGDRAADRLVEQLREPIQAFARQKLQEMLLATVPVAGVHERAGAPVTLPATLDYALLMPMAREQGAEGSAVGFAVAAALEFQIKRELDLSVSISPRHIMQLAKEAGGFDPHQDTGAFITDAVTGLRTRGAVEEHVWPYMAGQLGGNPPNDLDTAKRYYVSGAEPLIGISSIKQALAESGPVVAAVAIYSSLLDAEVSQTGVVPEPSPSDDVIALHAVCLVGYDDTVELFKFRNSWGTDWGSDGYGYISYEYARAAIIEAWALVL